MKFRFIYTALSFLLITGISSYGQSPGNFSIEKGLDNYPLGTKEPENDSLLMKANGGESLFNGVKYVIYFYKNTQENPYKLAEVDFKNLFLTYGNGKLGTIEFFKIYSDKLYPDHKNLAKEEFEKLYSFFKSQQKKKAKKRNTDTVLLILSATICNMNGITEQMCWPWNLTGLYIQKEVRIVYHYR